MFELKIQSDLRGSLRKEKSSHAAFLSFDLKFEPAMFGLPNQYSEQVKLYIYTDIWELKQRSRQLRVQRKFTF